MFRERLLSSLMLVLGTDAIAQSPSQLYGLDFSPYINSQDPNLNSQVSAAQITARMQVAAPYARWVRSFSSTQGLENIPSVARQLGLNVAASAWISRNANQNNSEIANLISAANAGQVDIAIVGSEALLRNDVGESQLISYMNQVRQAIPRNIPVTTADTYSTLLAHPNVIAASDVVFGNFYPYWEHISIDNAICSLAQQYSQLVAAAGVKQVVISETGWPSAGNAVGAAIPSPQNAARYFLQFVSWANSNAVPYFYFEAFDENWKAAYEGPQGAHWGIWDATGNLKPGMQAVFNGQTSPVTCDGTVGGPGAPAISFSYVPPYGSGDFLEGQILHVSPPGYGVAVYIYVAGGWWTKPTFAQPVTVIRTDGTWSANIVTGGSDQLATRIAAFLIPSTYSPPQLHGDPSLPSSLTDNSVAQVQINRTQNSISGAVTDSLAHPIAGVVIDAGVLGSTTSSPDGRYSFFNIPAAGSLTLTPYYPNFVFTPASVNVTITSGNQVADFRGTSTVDLAITSTVSSNQVPVGSSFTETLVVSNAGITQASDAIANVSLPSSFAIASASSTRGNCSVAGTQVTCDVGALAPTAYATIAIVATPTAAGPFNLTATVSGPDTDSNPANNTSSQAVSVVPLTGAYDLNADNKEDIVVYFSGSGGFEYSLLSIGNGTYNAVSTSGINPVGVQFDTVVQPDLNGDRASDIVFYDSVTGAFKAGIGNIMGSFDFASTITIAAGFTAVQRGDFNHDGKTDLLFYRKSDGLTTIALSNGDGTFSFTSNTFSAGFTTAIAGDFNGDGKTDVIFYNSQDAPYNGYLGIGDGAGNFTFSSLFLGPGFELFPADLNGDGKTDFLMYRPSDGTAYFALSSGAGFNYTYQLYSPGFTALKIGDINGDRFPDLVLYNANNGIGYLGIGNGTANFSFSSLFFGTGMDFVDLRDVNGDLKKDVVLYRSSDGTNYTGISTGANFNYTYNYFGPGRIVAR